MTNTKTSLILNKAHHIELSGDDRNKNVLIAGLPSTGVSSHTADFIFQDIINGSRTILFDPFGYLSVNLLSQMSSNQLEETAYLDVGNTEYPIGLNLLEVPEGYDKREIADAVLNLIYAIYDPNRTGIIGPRFDHAVRNAVLSVMHDQNSSFIELVRCLTDSDYINKLLPKISDPMVKNYWTKQIAQTSDFHKSEVLDYIVSKFGKFVSDTKIRNIIGQTKSSLNFDSLLSDKKIIIFDFSKLMNDYDGLKITSEIILFKLSTSLKKLSKYSFSLFIDEVDLFSNSKLTELLKYNRFYKLNLTLVSQRISELNSNLRNELLRSGTIISYRLSSADARILAPEFHKNITVGHLCLLKKFHFAMRTLKAGDPVIFEEINNERIDYNLKHKNIDIDKLKQEKVKAYGVPCMQVESEIIGRMV